MEQQWKEAAQAAQAGVQSAAEALVRGLANGVSFIALEEWTMAGAVEAAIDMLRDRMDPNMADLDQAIPQWVFQRAKARTWALGALPCLSKHRGALGLLPH
jgi:predicted NBD/HSP70 family sugar kinase